MKHKQLEANLQTYCDESSIHGVQYVAPSRVLLERILWAILIVVFFTSAGFVVANLLENWEENPIITTIYSTSYPIQKISFPAVTVCPNGFDVWAFAQRYNLPNLVVMLCTVKIGHTLPISEF